MPSDRYALGFDTSAAHCAAALVCGERVLVARAEEMGRGQAERLMPLLEEVLAEAGIAWADLSFIGVGTGPGNFTGIRISVSAARGLALGLGIEARGVSTFDAIRAHHSAAEGLRPAVPAPRDQVYVQTGETAPEMAPLEAAGDITLPPDGAAWAVAIARVALTGGGTCPAKPLYVKPADAAPPSDPPPVILDA